MGYLLIHIAVSFIVYKTDIAGLKLGFGVPDYQDGDINHIPCGHGGSVQFFFKIDGIIVHHTERVGAIDMDALLRGEGIVNVPPLRVAFDILPNASELEIIVTDSGDGDCGDNWIIGTAKLISDN